MEGGEEGGGAVADRGRGGDAGCGVVKCCILLVRGGERDGAESARVMKILTPEQTLPQQKFPQRGICHAVECREYVSMGSIQHVLGDGVCDDRMS